MAKVMLGLNEAYRGNLPEVCIRCGQPASVFKNRTISTGLLGLPFIGIPPIAIIAGKIQIRVPFCEVHKHLWRWRTLITIGGFFATCSLGLAGFLVAVDEPGAKVKSTLGAIMCLAFVIGLVLWVILAICLKLTGIYCASYDYESITLAGVAPGFADALDVYRRASPSHRFYD